MSDRTVRGLASIIVPCWGQLEYTRLCIAALKRHTRVPWELIVIDNGSTDHTGVYLTGVQDGANVPVTVISNPTNRGFPAAINQGLKAARGEFLVLLNNDVVVNDGWLVQLIALANANTGGATAEIAEDAERKTEGESDSRSDGLDERPREPHIRHFDFASQSDGAGAPRASRTIGLVGPMSNYATPPQLVEGVTYRDLAEMPAFARKWRDDHRGQWLSVPKLSGFCLLMKRAVYDAIGGLDERFGLGFFDDDDLAERARRAGFELAVARDLYVHHFGSRTFAGNGVDAEKLLDENAGRFAAKWGLREIGGRRVALRPWVSAEGEKEDLTQRRKGAKNSGRKEENRLGGGGTAALAGSSSDASPSPDQISPFAPLRLCAFA